MAKGAKGGTKGAKSGPGWKFVHTGHFDGAVKKAYDDYLTHWEILMRALEKEWNARYPDGKDGKFISFKTENGALKYLLKAKRAGSLERGHDVFGNPQ